MKTKLFSLVVFLILQAFTSHKYYVSTTHINYIPQSESLQITLHVFTDDMEELLVTSIIPPTHGLGTEKSALGDSKISTDLFSIFS